MKKLLIIITMIGFVNCSISQDQPNKKNNMKKVEKTETEWKAELNDLEYHVTREKGTERAFTGEFNENKKKGVYTCRCCQTALFSSETKYDSGSGWPSFYAPFNDSNVEEITDKSHGMVRTEVTCNVCDAHLGHVFTDGPKPTGLRYCINSISLDFEEK